MWRGGDTWITLVYKGYFDMEANIGNRKNVDI